MLKAYWIRLLLFAASGALIALVASSLVQPKYEAILDLLIDQKTVMPNVPISGADSSVSDLLDFARSRSLTTQVQTLTSFGTIVAACNRVAALNPATPRIVLGDGSDLDPIMVMDSITVTAEAQSDIISLRVRHHDVKIAQDIAREIYNAFSETSRRNTTELALRAMKKLQEMSGGMNTKLQAIDKKMTDLKLSVGSADLGKTIEAETAMLTNLKTARDAAIFDAATAEQRVKELARALNDAKATETTRSTQPNPYYQNIETSLGGAELRLSDLRVRYTDGHPDVKTALAQVAKLRADLAKTPKQIPNNSSVEGPGALSNSLKSSLAEARSAYEGSMARASSASGKVAEKEQLLQKFPAIQAQYTDLARQTVSLEKVKIQLDESLQSLEAAKTGRLSVVTAVTEPIAMPYPVSPKTAINILFGIAAGLIFGVLSMLATEAKRQPVRSLAQLNALALKPVYRLVPELRQPYRGLSKAPAEAFDSLLANYLRSGNRPYRVAVVGLVKDSGASTTAINLAIAGSRHGARVLLVQCDPRGGMSRMSGKQPPAEGEFTEISPLVKGTSAESILTLSGDRNPEITADIRNQEADLTVIDLEPTTKSAEYAFLAPHVDEVILLVRAGRSKSVEFLQAQQALKEAGCKQVTVAFTRSSDLAVVTESVDPDMESTPSVPKSLEE